MSNNAITKGDRAEIAADARTTARVVESMVLRGDISALSPEERAKFYLQMCEALGLSAASQPLAVLRLNGKEILYPTRGATDQLAAIHRLNREIVDGPRVLDVCGTKMIYAVCRATHPNGRSETAVATVPATDLLNALMKAETKAKRRATLSILGLGMLDETEIETIPAHVSRAPVAPPSREELAAVQLPSNFVSAVAALEIPAEAVDLWIYWRDEPALKDSHDAKKAAWSMLTARVEKLSNSSDSKSSKVWLKRAIAEETARRMAPSAPADAEREAEQKYQESPAKTPQAPAMDGERDPRSTPEFLALLDALDKATDTGSVVGAWFAHGSTLSQAGSDVLAEGKRETKAAWEYHGGAKEDGALGAAIEAARKGDEKPRTKSRSTKPAAAPLARSTEDYYAPGQWRGRIGTDLDAGHIAGGYHKRVEAWRAHGDLAHCRAITVERLQTLLALDESSASAWLDGCSPARRHERETRAPRGGRRDEAHPSHARAR